MEPGRSVFFVTQRHWRTHVNIIATKRLLTGLAAGDCLGSISEFCPRSAVLKLYDPTGWPLQQIAGGPFNWRKGEGTDDTDMAWAMVKAAIDAGGKFDADGTAKQFVAWLDGHPKDVGNTTRSTVIALRGKPWQRAGRDYWEHNKFNAANGSLMRNGVIPGITSGEDLNVMFDATVKHAIMTHYHPLPVMCCAIHSWLIADRLTGWGVGPSADEDWMDNFHEDWTAYLKQNEDPDVDYWIENTRHQFADAGGDIEKADFDPDSFNPYQESFAGRSGYCLLTLQIGVWALEWADRFASSLEFELPEGMPMREEMHERTKGPADVLAWVALIGHDSDSYGATAGALIAAAHPIPEHFTDGLEVVPLFDAAVTAAGDKLEDKVLPDDDE